jgi:hypothetical protein
MDRKENPINAPFIHIGALVVLLHFGPFMGLDNLFFQEILGVKALYIHNDH